MKIHKKGKRQNFRICALPHSTGTTSGGNIKGAKASVWRAFGGKYLYAELHGKVYENSDAAFEAMAERGYGSEFFRRESVVLNTFKDLDFMHNCAKFDALYRYFKWLEKQRKMGSRFALLVMERTVNKLNELAQKVGIFHPCSKLFNPTEYSKQVVFYNCLKCGREEKVIWPYQGKVEETRCWRCQIHA